MPGDFVDFELTLSEARRECPYQLIAIRSAIEAAFGPIRFAVSLQGAFRSVRLSVEKSLTVRSLLLKARLTSLFRSRV